MKNWITGAMALAGLALVVVGIYEYLTLKPETDGRGTVIFAGILVLATSFWMTGRKANCCDTNEKDS